MVTLIRRLAPLVDAMKFFGGDLDFPKIKKLKKVCYDVWTSIKMWKLYSKTVYCFWNGILAAFGLRGNLDYRDFFQKKFYNINSRYKSRTSPSANPEKSGSTYSLRLESGTTSPCENLHDWKQYCKTFICRKWQLWKLWKNFGAGFRWGIRWVHTWEIYNIKKSQGLRHVHTEHITRRNMP